MSTSPFTSQSALQIATPTPAGNFQAQFLQVANALLPDLLLVIGITAVFFLVLAGLRYIVAGGNPENAKRARAGLIHVVIGIVIVVATFSIIKLAVSFGNGLVTP
jgi:hypothetical protein